MARYIARRLLQAVTVLFGVSLVVFFMVRLSGDPTSLMLPLEAGAAERAAMRAQLGLDAPLYEQYARFLGQAIQGDLGDSLRGNQAALAMVLDRLPATAVLAGSAMVVAIVVAIPLGVIAGSRPGSWSDKGAMTVALFGQSVPNFWLGIMLILIFSVHLGWLPTGGTGSWLHLILPVVTLASWSVARTARLVRSGLMEVLSQDYVRTARAKGLSSFAVIKRHGIRNAMIPVVTVIGLDLAVLLGGAVVTETVFAWPGVGRLVVESIDRRDFPVVQAAVLVIAVIYVLINLIVDIIYTVIDPRMKLA